MRPIVNGLEAEFTERAAFEYFNARDSAAGQAAFDALGLVGHPAVLVFDAAGHEVYRSYGLMPANDVRAVLALAVADP